MAERFFAVARTEDLIVQEMGPETLVFDRRTDVAHNLSPIASVVWSLCDGKHDVDALVAAVAEIEPADAQAATDAALAELGELGLLVDGVSRRETVKKMAKLGAGAFTAPLVVSVIAPTVAMAVSGNALYDRCPAGSTSASTYCKVTTSPTAKCYSGGGANSYCTTNSQCSQDTATVNNCAPNNSFNAGTVFSTNECCSGSCTTSNNGNAKGTCTAH